jgi:hypothetical protein
MWPAGPSAEKVLSDSFSVSSVAPEFRTRRSVEVVVPGLALSSIGKGEISTLRPWAGVAVGFVDSAVAGVEIIRQAKTTNSNSAFLIVPMLI